MRSGLDCRSLRADHLCPRNLLHDLIISVIVKRLCSKLHWRDVFLKRLRGAPMRSGSSSLSLLLASLELSHTTIYEPQMRAHFESASHFCDAVVLKLRSVPQVWTVDPSELIFHEPVEILGRSTSNPKPYTPHPHR